MQRVKINQVANFIRKNDNWGLFKKASGNKLRNYIYNKLKNQSLYFFLEEGKITGFLEYYRFSDFETLGKHMVKRLPMPLKGSGKTVWVHQGLLTKRGVLKRNFRGFVEHMGDIDNIYWWKPKKGKLILCKFRR